MAAVETEPKYWYARVDVPVLEEGEQVDTERRLIVVSALSPADARRESGFVEAEFELATDEILGEWDVASGAPLTDEEIGRLMTLVRRDLIAVANKEAKAEGFGRTRNDRYRILDRYRAAMLVQLQGKLDTMLHE